MAQAASLPQKWLIASAVSAREHRLAEGVQIDDGRDADDKAAHAAEQVENQPRVDGVLGDAIDKGIAGDDGMGRQIDAVDEGAGDARRRIVAERRSRRFRGGKAPLAQGGFGVDVGRAQMWGRLQE